MKKYDIFGGIKGEDTQFEKGLEFPTYADALSYAEYFAYDIYYLNPKRDILDIMKEEDVNEDIAEIIFLTEMIASVNYSAVEVE